MPLPRHCRGYASRGCASRGWRLYRVFGRVVHSPHPECQCRTRVCVCVYLWLYKSEDHHKVGKTCQGQLLATMGWQRGGLELSESLRLRRTPLAGLARNRLKHRQAWLGHLPLEPCLGASFNMALLNLWHKNRPKQPRGTKQAI